MPRRTPPPPPKQPLWRTVVVGALATAAVGTILVWVFDDSEPPPALPEGKMVDEDGEVVDRRVAFEADRENRRRAAMPRRNAALMLETLAGAGPGAAEVSDLQTARDSFTNVITEIEVMAERPRAMKQRKWQALYRAANDSFSALSMHLDAKDPVQKKELEDAHKQLVNALAIVRVRGGKFKVR
ncbi:MAG: hypothetical protein AAGA54_21030 [Myxococcota bacterium]